jgi:hypothetical protein
MRMTRARTRLAIALLLLSAGRSPAQTAPPPRVELIHIDGSKNPELIPQWSAWGYAFRVFAGGPRQLPTTLVQHVSKEEEAFLLAHADLVQRTDADCQQRLSRIVAKRGVEKLEALDRKVRDLAVECRWATLDARDRVLAGLNPEAQLALMAFVESMKAGTSVTVPKARLARFREPE